VARYTYERLSAQDFSFLLAEDERSPMHVGALALLESGPLKTSDGGFEIETYRSAIESVLHWIPRYRQILRWTPLEGWPVWVDDRHFNLNYHIRHIALPKPGTTEQLQELASRIFGRRLDRSRPLWEIWVIEGVEGGDQFALLNKVHHCMIDGAAGADLSQILFSPSSNVELPKAAPYLPRPEPSPTELFLDSASARVSGVASLATKMLRAMAEPEQFLAEGSKRLTALGELGKWSLRPASETPINGRLTPHRRCEWMTMPLDDIRELRRVLGCTVNDLVLATVCGAMRRYFLRRRVDPTELDFRISAPVNVRRAEDAGKMGNHVSSWIVRLPLGEADPMAQLNDIRSSTEQLKRTHASLAIETVMGVAEHLPPSWIRRGVAMSEGPINMVVTNVPGPQVPLYCVGSRLLGVYPMVPLLQGAGLGVALFSYEGKLGWGFNADYELVPDLDLLVGDFRKAFEDLRRATVTSFLERRTAPPEQETDDAAQTLSAATHLQTVSRQGREAS
jgi:diacylglycerol O-acyltransferase